MSSFARNMQKSMLSSLKTSLRMSLSHGTEACSTASYLCCQMAQTGVQCLRRVSVLANAWAMPVSSDCVPLFWLMGTSSARFSESGSLLTACC